MPADSLRAKLGECRKSVELCELADVKRLFCVSMQALVHRCRDLGIVSDALYQRLFGDLRRRGWVNPPYDEPEAMRSERPRRFRRLCFRALAEGAVSESRAAELLGCSVWDLDRLMYGPFEEEGAVAGGWVS